jgi:hypothetical protein
MTVTVIGGNPHIANSAGPRQSILVGDRPLADDREDIGPPGAVPDMTATVMAVIRISPMVPLLGSPVWFATAPLMSTIAPISVQSVPYQI